MRHHEIGPRQVLTGGLDQHRIKVLLEFGEIIDMAHHPVRHRPVGKPLSPPVDGDDGKPARDEITRCATIFLDALRPAG